MSREPTAPIALRLPLWVLAVLVTRAARENMKTSAYARKLLMDALTADVRRPEPAETPPSGSTEGGHA